MVGDRKLAPDHHRHNCALGRLSQVHFADELPVAHDGRATANLEHFVHLVGDVDDGNTSRREVGDHDGETLELAWGQAGRRLIHGDDAGVLEQRASDLDDLPLSDLEGFDLRVRADRGIERRERSRGSFLLGGPVDEDGAAAQRAAEEHILSDSELADLLKLLVDHRDPGPARVEGPAQGQNLTVDRDRPGIRLHHAGHRTEQGRLSCAVFAEESVNFTRTNAQRHVA